MATNKRTWTPQIVRDRIKVMQIVNRLQDFALNVPGVKMTTQQIRAAEILLRKTVPDLSSVALSGEDGRPLQVQLVSFLDATKESLAKHSNPQETDNAV